MSSVRYDTPPRDTQEAVFRFLADPKTHGRSEPVERVDTAGAVVFLAGADAYKVKRAVKFPFMDLSTLDKRREACEAEIAVNRPSAPQIYLSALPITQQGGTFALGGDGEIVEWVTHTRRFDENATLDRIADHEGALDAIIDKLALAVRRSHARAPLRDGARAAHALDTYIEQNNAAFAERPDLFDPPAARKLTVDSRLAFALLRPVLLKRAAAGAAAEVGAAFSGLFLNAPLATRLERIASRRNDASDADADVARRQTAEPLSEKGWAAVAASGSLSDTTVLARARL